MTAQDFFSPANNAKLDQDDADLGSGGPVALPDDYGSAAHPHLLIVAGKDGTVWLLDRDNLGGMGQGAGGTDNVVSSTLLKGVWGRAAVFDTGTTHYVYMLPSTSPLEAMTVSPNGSGQPTLTTIAASAASYAYTSGSPVVTSDGQTASSALVWIVGVDGSNGANGRLLAYPAVPPASGAWVPVASFPLGSMAKFFQPATDGGRIFVGTRDGRVLAFGRPTTAALSAPPTDFGTACSSATARSRRTSRSPAQQRRDGQQRLDLGLVVHRRHTDTDGARPASQRPDAHGAGHLHTNHRGCHQRDADRQCDADRRGRIGLLVQPQRDRDR